VNSPVAHVDEIFWEAARLPAGQQRDTYLARACRDDHALRQRVERLLQVQGKVSQFLEQPFVDAAAMTSPPEVGEGPGSVIGPYKLLEQIGEGGMGLVFLAEQTQPVRRQVALKILKPGTGIRQVVARFEAERQALALMDHPNIARIFDAGTVASSEPEALATATRTVAHAAGSAFGSGRPYFVMELVKGVPITDFCDQHRLTTRRRLELFVTVCQAVQHAHQKGIIHRDLKPSNVLVTLHDTVAVPKVIDFGIAKAVGQRLTEHTLFTQFTQILGSPLYMSPEQAEMNGLDVDTRSDVYTLGVLLYELLTGTTPFEKETLKQAGFDEMRRLIREQEPARPSHRVSTLGLEACTTVSEQRGVDGRRLSELLRGELDWIVMKTLEKDRNRRYESASALAADVQRYLNDEPVEACPPSASYRLRKFARRNWRALATAGLIAVALVAATAVSGWQAMRAWDAQQQAEGERDRAKTAQSQAEAAKRQAATEAAIAKAISRFLQRDLLEHAASAPEPGQELGGDPYLTVREALQRAAARIGKRFQDQPLVEAAIQTTIGGAYNSLQEYKLALPHLDRAVALHKAHLGPDNSATLASMAQLAASCMWVGRHQDTIALHQQILENRKAQFGPNHAETLASVGALAHAYWSAGQLDTSGRLLEDVQEKQRTILGLTHPNTLATMHQLALNYEDEERLAESIALHEKVLELRKSTVRPEHPSTLASFDALAQVCQRAGKLDQSERLLRESLEECRKHEDSLWRRMTEANARGWLARCLVLQQRFDAAEPLIREAVAVFEKQQPNAVRRFFFDGVLGAVLLGQRNYKEAEPALLRAYEQTKQSEHIWPARGKRRLAEAGERVIRFYEVTQQPENARLWREKLGITSHAGGSKN
jgi:serine/threonine protein kinase